VEQQLLGELPGGDSLPDVRLPDVPLPDVPLPNVPVPNVPLLIIPLHDVPLPEARPVWLSRCGVNQSSGYVRIRVGFLSCEFSLL
jgi:hypothetical protein